MTFFVGGAILGAGIIGAGASIFGSTQQQRAQQSAINQQMQAQNLAMAQIKEFDQPFIDYSKSMQPDLSQESNTLNRLLTPGANQTQMLSQLPGFQFTEDLAKWGIQAGAGQRGYSGSTALAGGQAASGIASQYWDTLIQQLQGKYQQDIGLYGTGANVASGAGGQTANVVTGTGSNISSLLAAQGQTGAAGIMGAAGGLGGALTLNALLSAFKNQNGGAVDPNTGLNQNEMFNMVSNTGYP